MSLVMKFTCFLLVLALAGPFFLKLPNGEPIMTLEKLGIPSLSNLTKLAKLSSTSEPLSPEKLTQLANKSGGKQMFYKWKDKNGIWQFTEEPPPENNTFDTIETDANANIIQSLPQAAIDSALGRESGKNHANTVSDLGSGLDSLGGLSPTTVPITQIPKLFNDAKKARQLMEEHTKSLEAL